jgi:hypothetical protein
LGVLCEASHLSKEKTHAKKSSQRIAGLINGCGQKRVKQNKEYKIIIGTWNVRTLLHPGTMQELAEQIKRNTTRNTSSTRNKMKWNWFNKKTELLITLLWT